MHVLHRITAVAAVALAAIIAVPAASAHVTANPNEAAAGGFTKLDFRVPNEQDVPTVGLTVQMPDGIYSVSVKPVPGWTAEVTKTKLDEPAAGGHGEEFTEQVSEITWTGGEIRSGEFQEFPISLQLPEKGQLGDLVFFPAVQTYEGGEEVSWIDKPAAATDDLHDLEKPAPHVTLTGAGDDHHDEAADEDTAEDDDGAAVTAMKEGVSKDYVDDEIELTKGMAVVAIIIGMIASIIGLVAFRRAGKR